MVEQFMTVEDVAKTLKLSKSTVRRAIHDQELEVYRVGSQPQIRISQQQLARYLESRASRVNGSRVAAAAEAGIAVESRRSSPTPPTVYQGQTATGLNWKLINADVVSGLSVLADKSINMVVTSPPYYWQRDYEVDDQIGHESSVEGYITALRVAFREIRRVLRDDGVFFLNIGDTYYSAKGRPHGKDPKHRARQLSRKKLRAVDGPGFGLPRKSLLGIPWRVALAMQEDGWVLRSSIIWQRPAPMPEPTAHDRPWRTHEPIFLFSKRPRYWFNRGALNGDEDIWRISARPYNPGSHFAPYPLELADRCVRAGCPVGGTVLDPFVGSGTSVVAALFRGMQAIGIDLKSDYCDFVRDQVSNEDKLSHLFQIISRNGNTT